MLYLSTAKAVGNLAPVVVGPEGAVVAFEVAALVVGLSHQEGPTRAEGHDVPLELVDLVLATRRAKVMESTIVADHS